MAALESSDSPTELFRLRSESYLVDRVKAGVDGADMRLVATTLSAGRPARPTAPPGKRRLRFEFGCPGGLYFCIDFGDDGPGESELLDRLFDADDAWRRERLKMVPLCTEGPWLLRLMMGKPAIVARALTTTFEAGPGWLVARLDVAASHLGSRLFGRVTRSLASLVVDLGFVVEARGDGELPERLLGAARMPRLCFNQARARAAAAAAAAESPG